MKSRFKSSLYNTVKRKAEIVKIAALYAQKPSRLVFDVGGDRFNAAEATNVALDGAAAHNNIIFTRPTGATVKASLVVQALTYTAVAAGTGGNAITIAYTNTGTAGSEVVSVVSNAISVAIQSGVSTANQIKAAILASAPAIAKVSVALTGTGTATQVTASATNLAGGAATEQYDLADIQSIRRLRTKKYLVRIKSGSDPAVG